ncbi:Fe-S oxidoreductase [Sulfuricaulis limicola]|uniref:Fe-S oxidoreductase n=1 Tax=Sulfuricaulis limicola TaxID=1620215 RepID=A0A1B4XEF9_9GAMM|nr:(Fe-S)-binding protein [Sulfuricaulis limicola]BAV33163.1 Fe-S oxidoreductase [Sulfuricaulis limicola]
MRVGLFVTCLVDLMRPSIGFAALRLLEAAGCEVVVPAGQTCCGQPGYNSGDSAAARALALKLLKEFEGCDYVVAPSGSCTGMIRAHYPALFKDDPGILEAVQRLSVRTYELTDFLVNVVKIKNIPGRYTGTLTYHDSCAGLRELGVQAQPRALLAKMPGVTLTEMQNATTCCGFGGTFSVKFGDISTRMADRKCASITQTGAGTVVAGDLGCLLNIEGRLRRNGDAQTRVLHIAEVLAGDNGENAWK